MDQDFSTLINNYFQHDYRDRGIKKWRGFFLSDHTSALRKMDQDNVYTEKKLPKMTTDKIFHNAMHALANYYTVTIQLDETTFNHETKKIYLGSLKTLNWQSPRKVFQQFAVFGLILQSTIFKINPAIHNLRRNFEQ